MKDHLIVGMVQATAAGAAAALAGDTLTADTTNIVTESSLRWICVFGSIGGGLLTMLLFPQKEIDPALEKTDPPMYLLLKRRSGQRMIAKVLSQFLGGLMFTPWLYRLTGFELTEDRVLAFSAFVSMIIVALIHFISPRLEPLGNVFFEAFKDYLFKKYLPPKE